MTDQQILTIVIAIVFPVTALIYSMVASKDRIGDLNTNLGKRMDGMDKRMDSMDKHLAEMEERLIAHIDNAFQHMELLLKLHEAEHHKK